MKIYYFLISIIFLCLVSCNQASNTDDDDDDDEDYDDVKLSAAKISKTANEILAEKHWKEREQFFAVTLRGDDSFEDENEGISEVKSRGLMRRGFGVLQQGGKKLLTASRNNLRKLAQSARDALNWVANVISERGKMLWDSIKEKAANLKKEMKEYVKDTVKDFMFEIYEEGKEKAYEYFKAMLMDMIKAEMGISCECPVELTPEMERTLSKQKIEETNYRCKCCIKIPELKTGCIFMQVMPKTNQIVVTLQYDEKEFLKARVTDSLRGPCAQPIKPEEIRACSPLPEELHILNACIIPQKTEIDNEETGAFTGCFTLAQEQMQLAFERCVSYDPLGIEQNDNFLVAMFHPDEL